MQGFNVNAPTWVSIYLFIACEVALRISEYDLNNPRSLFSEADIGGKVEVSSSKDIFLWRGMSQSQVI